jgi:hypothetical protein
MSDQPVAEAAIYLRTYTFTNTHKRRISMPTAGLETAVPANKWLQTYIL